LIRLRDLLPEDPIPQDDVADRPIAGVTADSRAVRPGFLFFALPGAKTDGLAFARDARAAGAAAVATQAGRLASEDLGIPVVETVDARRALALAAAAFYPRQPRVVAAVTGTSGKTSVAAFVRQIWSELGHCAAALGTTGVVTSSGTTYGSLTTPDPVTLHRIVDELAGRGATHLAMEASSHGLDQRRLDGMRLSAGAFTNLSRDHLDYHESIEDYFQAKLRLFDTLLPAGASAVVNVDDAFGARVVAAARARGMNVVEVGRGGKDIRLREISMRPGGALLEVEGFGAIHEIELPLAGDFMASNALVAAGVCIATGSAAAETFAALAKLQGAPGRLEKVAQRRGAPIFVDYAHKPDALEKVLRALRPLAARALVVVFGCGGDRDAGKRPIMGSIAVAEADVVIVTDDNPRSENPSSIRADILAAAPGAREIGDRREAIRAAVGGLAAGDVLVVAGKGHETGQIVGDRVLPFSDRDEILEAVEEAPR
jgi:UDP-N-acetylmuramoyl-L-alanyl-D-glutamate--2,6-diaminopimelate ligase